MGWQMANENRVAPQFEPSTPKESEPTQKMPADITDNDQMKPAETKKKEATVEKKDKQKTDKPKKKRGCFSKFLIGVVVLLVLVIAIPTIGMQVQKAQKESVTYVWPSSGLATLLPEPESKNGEINANDSDDFDIDVFKTDSAAYSAYVEACKEKGFTLESSSLSSSYRAFDESGNKLSVSYYTSINEMSISLDAPIEMSEITWPTVGIGSQVPAPTSLVGKISTDRSDRYTVYLSMDEDTFNAYVDTCIVAGYNVDHSRSDKGYSASNDAGTQIKISYQGGGVVYLDVKPVKDSTADSTDTDSSDVSTEDETQESASETTADAAATTEAQTEEQQPVEQESQTEQATETQQSGQSEQSSGTPIADAVSSVTSNFVSADFKEFIDGYESFMNEYCDFMVKYASAQSSNDTATLATMLADYTSLVQQEAEWIDKMNAVDTDSLSAADSAYYLAATARIEKRLAEIGLSNS